MKQQLLDSYECDEKTAAERLKQNIPNKEAAIWPVLADTWVRSVLKL